MLTDFLIFKMFTTIQLTTLKLKREKAGGRGGGQGGWEDGEWVS